MNQKIGVAVVGTGFGATVQIPAFAASPETEVVAVCSSRLERAQQTAKEFSIPHALDDYQALLQLSDVQLVSIAAPPHLHHSMALAALQAGKHVLCEKPFALNLAQAREMHQRAQRSGRIHMIDHEFRFVPARARAKELIDEGYLGEFLHAQVTLFYGPRGDLASARPWNWLCQKELGGGMLGAIGSHYIDATRHFFGEVSSVSGELLTLVKERPLPDLGEMRPCDADDVFEFTLRLAAGGHVSVAQSSVARFGSGARVEIFGTQGTLVIERDRTLLGARQGEGGLAEIPLPDHLTRPDLTTDPRLLPFMLLIEKLADGIRSGQNPSPNFGDALRCQEIMDAIHLSHDRRRWIDLPLTRRPRKETS